MPRSHRLCYLCGSLATTRDHIPRRDDCLGCAAWDTGRRHKPPEVLIVLRRYKRLVVSQPIHRIGSSVFDYRCLMAQDNTDASAWVIVFYERVLLMTVMYPREWSISK